MKLIAAILVCLIATDLMSEVIADFEGGDYGQWKTDGTAFGNAPAKGTLPRQMQVDGFKGKGLVNSFHGGDDSTGKLTSPDFKISEKYITFLIGGGGWKGETCMNLIVDGKTVETATGPNVVSGGSENLAFMYWDVSRWNGKTVHLEIVDNRKGGWGHINVDHIEMRNDLPPQPELNVVRPYKVIKRYMMLPVKNGTEKCNLEIWSNGDKTRFFNIELAPQEPDWWAFLDLNDSINCDIELKVDKLSAGSKALKNIHFEDEAIDIQTALYKEDLRPQFHFSARRGWNNDPNGLCYYNDEYHLFFQHNPYGTKWGNMHWGHAVSKDLIHWKELPEALYPDALGPMFSGSAVVDHNNTSGFGKDGKDPLVLIYTAAGNPATQCIAYSTDGRNFIKYENNPVVKNITPGNRDPKVFWHEPSKQWVMVFYAGRENGRHTIEILKSTNLKEWNHSSTLSGGTRKHSRLLFECPDLFPLKVEGENTVKWVAFGASLDYLTGNFDGSVFTPESNTLPGCTEGSKIYAAQTYSDHPENKRILTGWMRAESPEMPFNQCMTIPQELGLKRTPCGVRLTHKPAKEIELIREKSQNFSIAKLTPSDSFPFTGFPCREQEFHIKADLSYNAILQLSVNGIKIVYISAAEILAVDNQKMKWPNVDGELDMRIFIDRTCVEIFSGDGLLYGAYSCIQNSADLNSKIELIDGEASDVDVKAYKLKSCWE